MPNLRKLKLKAKQHALIKLLLAEDYAPVVSIERILFDRSGFSVSVARNEKELLKKLKREFFDVVLIDSTFDQGNGLSGIANAKKKSLNMHIKFVVSSILETDSSKTQIEQNKADLVLFKPLPFQKIHEEIRKLIHNSYRKSERIYQTLNITLKQGFNKVSLKTIDICMDGMLVSDKSRLIKPIVGTLFNIEIELPEVEYKIDTKGIIVRITDNGFGIKFLEIKTENKEILSRFISKHSLDYYTVQYY